MSVIINPALREQLGLNISSSELKKLEKLDVKNIRNVDILRLKQTLVSSHNWQKKAVIVRFLAKLDPPPRPLPPLPPKLQAQPPRPLPALLPRLQPQPRAPKPVLLPRLQSQQQPQPQLRPPRPLPQLQPPVPPRLRPQPQSDAQPLHPKLSSHVDSRQLRKIHLLHPEKISQLMDGAKAGKYEKFEGTNREVFIDKKTGQGYKIFKQDSTWTKLTNADLRVNDIYHNHSFYGGKYARFATNEIITMRDDRVRGAPPVKVFSFQQIPGAKHLENHEQIPYSVLVMMERAGFRPFDVKPGNFMKIENMHGEYDYLPIDAKQIGLTRSNSERSKEVRYFKEQHGPYYYGQRFVDYKK